MDRDRQLAPGNHAAVGPAVDSLPGTPASPRGELTRAEIDALILQRLTERQDAVGAIPVWIDPNDNPLHIPTVLLAAALGVEILDTFVSSPR